jgi:acyl CoA:acetate/3-ketoacid CoA transferase beta subunit
VYRVVTNLAVLDFGGPLRTMRLVSVHPGVSVSDVVEQTGFPLDVNGWCVTRAPSDDELRLLETLDPAGRREREVPS